MIQKALNKTFAPEFLNRLDEIITFDQLSLEAITKIVDIELKGLYERVEAIGYKLVVEDDAKRFVASKEVRCAVRCAPIEARHSEPTWRMDCQNSL